MDKALKVQLDDALDEGVQLFREFHSEGQDMDQLTSIVADELVSLIGEADPKRMALFVAVAMRRIAEV